MVWEEFLHSYVSGFRCGESREVEPDAAGSLGSGVCFRDCWWSELWSVQWEQNEASDPLGSPVVSLWAKEMNLLWGTLDVAARAGCVSSMHPHPDLLRT